MVEAIARISLVYAALIAFSDPVAAHQTLNIIALGAHPDDCDSLACRPARQVVVELQRALRMARALPVVIRPKQAPLFGG